MKRPKKLARLSNITKPFDLERLPEKSCWRVLVDMSDNPGDLGDLCSPGGVACASGVACALEEGLQGLRGARPGQSGDRPVSRPRKQGFSSMAETRCWCHFWGGRWIPGVISVPVLRWVLRSTSPAVDGAHERRMWLPVAQRSRRDRWVSVDLSLFDGSFKHLELWTQ